MSDCGGARRLVARAGVITLLLAAGETAGATEGPSSGADQARALAAMAVAANPSVKAIEARVEALGQRVHQAGAWADPVVSLDYSNMPIDAWRPGKHSMSGVQIGLRQTFFYPGKLGLRRDVAKARVRVAEAALAEHKVQLRARVQQAYYRLALVRQLEEVSHRHLRVLERFGEVVRVKYEVGKASQQDLLRLQMLAGKLHDELQDFRRDDRALGAAINAALHREPRVTITTPERIEAIEPAESSSVLAKRAKKRPRLQQFTHEARTQQLAARQLAREGYPDFSASAGYRFRWASGDDPGTDFVGFAFSMPIPLWHDQRWGSARRESEALARAAERERDAELDAIRGELERVMAGWRRAAEQAQAYRDKLLPLAQRALDATFAAYQVDQADFASLFQAEVQLLDFERTLRRAEAGTRLHRVEAEALLGSSLQGAL